METVLGVIAILLAQAVLRLADLRMTDLHVRRERPRDRRIR
jgi:hypothetical protein